jgi:CheY-like chemotaxis protein
MALILVADDDEGIRITLQRALERRGHQVELVGDGMALAERAQDSRPQLIVCDIQMPNVYGTSAYSILQRDPLTAQIPVIFVTGLPVETVRPLIPDSPRVRLLVKPVDDDELNSAVSELLSPPQQT